VTQPLHWPIIILLVVGFAWYVWHHVRRGRESVVVVAEESAE
jgi:hypothetical protein